MSKRINKFNLTQVDDKGIWGGEISVDEDPPAVRIHLYAGTHEQHKARKLRTVDLELYGMDVEFLRDELTKALRVYRRRRVVNVKG